MASEEKSEELQHQYSPSKWVIRSIPDGQNPVQYFVNFGLEVKEKLVKQFKSELNILYGNGEKTKLDIYYPKVSGSQINDVLIFLHGGYWQEGSKDCYAFFGAHLDYLDCILVMVGYDLAPSECMDGMVEQVKKAIAFIGKKFPSSRLFLSGHSAGAHLSAMMMTVNWEDTELAPSQFSGVCLLCGVYDLEPLLMTSVNDPIKMDKECAARNSPMKIVLLHGVAMKCKVLVMIAERDSPAFHKQSKDFYNLLKEKLPNHNVQYLEVPEVDHFSFMEKCVEKDYIVNKVLARFIKE